MRRKPDVDFDWQLLCESVKEDVSLVAKRHGVSRDYVFKVKFGRRNPQLRRMYESLHGPIENWKVTRARKILAAEGGNNAVARQFNIDPAAVSRIRRGLAFKEELKHERAHKKASTQQARGRQKKAHD